MLLKHVQILKSGRQIKAFDCAECDLSHQVLHFRGVVGKNRMLGNNITINHVGETYIEVDRVKRECIVIPTEPDIQMLITW